MSIGDLDIVAQGLGRICGAHVGKPKFTAWVTALLQEGADIKSALEQLYTLVDVDASTGVQLDVIGALVGQPRRLTGALVNAFFGFLPVGGGEYQLALPMGDDNIEGLGGQMYDEDTSVLSSSSLLNDVDYRKAIKARIVYNNTRAKGDGTAYSEGLFSVLRYIFPDAGSDYLPGFPLYVHNDYAMHITIGVGKVPTQQERALINYAEILPVPSCVNYSVVYWNDAAQSEGVYPFGFDGMSNVLGFGDDDFPGSPGGIFAEELS
jgi:hypothetical protein